MTETKTPIKLSSENFFYDKNLKFRPPNVCIRILDLKFKKIYVKIQKIKIFIFRTCIFLKYFFLFIRTRACFLVLAHTTCPPMTLKGRIRLCDEEQGSNDNWFPFERLPTVYNCCHSARSALPDKKILIRHNKI